MRGNAIDRFPSQLKEIGLNQQVLVPGSTFELYLNTIDFQAQKLFALLGPNR